MPTVPTASNPVTLNDSQELYVIYMGGGVTCLGYDVCQVWIKRLVAWMAGKPLIAQFDGSIPARGTLEAYTTYQRLSAIAGDYCTRNKIRCNVVLSPQLDGLEGKRVEVVDCFGEVRRFIVGKSAGWMPCHLEIANARAQGGARVYGAPFKSVRIIR